MEREICETHSSQRSISFYVKTMMKRVFFSLVLSNLFGFNPQIGEIWKIKFISIFLWMVKVFECIPLVLHSIVINCLTLNIDYGLSYIIPKQSRTSHVKNFRPYIF